MDFVRARSDFVLACCRFHRHLVKVELIPVFGIPVMAAIVPLAKYLPNPLRTSAALKMIVVVAALGWIFGFPFFLNVLFKDIENSPELADPCCTPRERAKTIAGYFFLAFVWLSASLAYSHFK